MNQRSQHSNRLHIISVGFHLGKQHYAYKYVHMVMRVKLFYSSWCNLLAYFLLQDEEEEASGGYFYTQTTSAV